MSYRSIHGLLLKRFGPARHHLCASCLGQAAEWAYLHTAGASELLTAEGRPFSHNPDDYAPMCRSCHRLLDIDSYGHLPEAALAAGAKVARRMAEDPEYRKHITENLGSHLEKMKTDSEYSGRYRAYMRRTNFTRRRCSECGLETNPGNLGKHQTATGHQGWTEVMANV